MRSRHRPASRPLRPGALAALVACAALALTAAVLAAAPPAPGPAAQGTPPRARPSEPVEELPQGGDDQRVQIVLNAGQAGLIRLAVPDIEGVGRWGGDFGPAARDLDATLRNDLEQSGVFLVHGPWAFAALTLTGERTHDFEQYRSLGDEYLIQGKVEPERDRMVFEGRLYDLKRNQSVLAKRYVGDLDSARRIAHTFADEVILLLTGNQGISRTRIAFASLRNRVKEIYVMDYDGANVQQVTAHRSTSLAPTWSPSGGDLLYTSFVGGSPGIYRADLSTGRKTALLTEGEQNITASYSPDGRRIVFSRALGANTEIFVADANGLNLRRLTHSEAIDTNPAWSPSGTEIAFTSNRAGNPHVFIMDVEGTNVRRISTQGNYNDGASWSPEGDRLVYASRVRGNFDIALTDVVTLATRLLTSAPGSHEEPTFSPDGRRIAFSSTRGAGAKQIWVMDADGAHQQPLTAGGSNESPAWSPYPAR